MIKGAVEQDVLSEDFRRSIIEEILNDENKRRKSEALRRFEILQNNLSVYLKSALEKEYSKQSEAEMRKISSINPAARALKEIASIYRCSPERTFQGASKEQEKFLEEIYDAGKFNVKLKKANKYLKGIMQGALQVIPCEGAITAKVFAPHQYDVIPHYSNPEKAMAYVINTFDQTNYRQLGDGVNQKIADKEDFLALAAMRFVWWSDSYNFETDGNGKLIVPEEDVKSGDPLANPIGKLPFIDIAGEKDFSFWVTDGSPLVDFALDFALLLSDTATVNRNQGFSQAIFTSKDKPESMTVGRQRILYLPQDPDPQAKDPKFEFVTPSPDLAASLELLESYVRYWLTSMGMDPKVVSAKGEAKSFASGLERLLAMLEKFEASQDDIDLFKWVEQEIFELVVLWNNYYQGSEYLREDLKKGTIPDKVTLAIQFEKPEMVQTKSEKEDSLIKLKKEGLIDDVEMIMELEEVDEETAMQLVVERQVRQAKVKKMIQDQMQAEGLAQEQAPAPADPSQPPQDQAQNDQMYTDEQGNVYRLAGRGAASVAKA